MVACGTVVVAAAVVVAVASVITTVGSVCCGFNPNAASTAAAADCAAASSCFWSSGLVVSVVGCGLLVPAVEVSEVVVFAVGRLVEFDGWDWEVAPDNA